MRRVRRVLRKAAARRWASACRTVPPHVPPSERPNGCRERLPPRCHRAAHLRRVVLIALSPRRSRQPDLLVVGDHKEAGLEDVGRPWPLRLRRLLLFVVLANAQQAVDAAGSLVQAAQHALDGTRPLFARLFGLGLGQRANHHHGGGRRGERVGGLGFGLVALAQEADQLVQRADPNVLVLVARRSAQRHTRTRSVTRACRSNGKGVRCPT